MGQATSTPTMGWVLAVSALILAMGVAYMSGLLSGTPPPLQAGDGWWGRGDKPAGEEDGAVREFEIHLSEEGLEDLRGRLRNTRWFDGIEGTGFTYGTNPAYTKQIVDYWLNQYDWRQKEAELNQYPNYKTNIEGIDIHFVRATPKLKPGQKAKPILMVHGWPGSFYEFYKIIPMLIDPSNHGGNEEDTFEVIVPSLPGYGFSEAAHKQGLTAMDAGRIFHKLMLRLGLDSYYVQGGDWGSRVVDQMSSMFHSHIRGVHINFLTSSSPSVGQIILGKLFPSLALDDPVYAKSLPGWDRLVYGLMETGYLHIQATKPDTLGHALTDSPAGLAAYIMEKFSSWTNYDWKELDDGGLEAHWSKDDLLTDVMIYWVSGCITSSMRLYKETIGSYLDVPKYVVTIPAGLADLPHELTRTQKSWAARHYTDIVSYTTYPTGGHFAAFEVPDLLAKDLRQFVQKVEARLANQKK